MEERTLNVYENFTCIASDCPRNCCEKWDINIDKKTLNKYKNYGGAFSLNLKNGIDFENSRFKMEKQRCVFLNGNNLCDILINLGEKYLCQVCRDHPRYRNYFSDRIETGIGLCCPVICEKILSFDNEINEIIVKEKTGKEKFLKEFEKKVLEFRDKTFAVLKREDTLSVIIEELLDIANVDKKKFYSFNYKKLLLSLEILDNKWIESLNLLNDKLENNFYVKDRRFKNLLYCFLYRHLAGAVDGLDLSSRLLFSVFSILTIYSLSEKSDKNLQNKSIENIAVFYSSEIEYSTDNFYSLLSLFDEMIKR